MEESQNIIGCNPIDNMIVKKQEKFVALLFMCIFNQK